jgi:thiamine-monophosphate kinase
MNEWELIRALTRNLAQPPSVVVGPGDDCAVLDVGLPGEYLLFKTDAVAEGVHFDRDTAPERIGRKAINRCLSDVAAMAGTPTHALVTLAMPAPFDPELPAGLYRGMTEAAARHGVAIVGGETTAHPHGLFLSIALLGRVPADRCPTRAGGRPGDALFVTGELGGSRAGRHLEFEPRLEEARWLADQCEIHAMIDLSDGLAGDLPHLLRAAGCGAELRAESIPISAAAKRQARAESSAKPPLLAALSDGEDFELLLAVDKGDAVPLLDGWRIRFPEVRLTCIGRLTDRPGLWVRDREGTRRLTAHGYTHFE